ncbi:unnamed protein product [Effrenium voratum]|uniref:PPPDE domain-containing protein n=1 Tax=Effrenium voratum TaxID=2562239 RepID=A0AA36HW86_9DINO|nr:unnamed protein product [Effrenium voratum]CAJ1376505.1 unnamed protein product [Effrenium voratum]CAJ1420250.1 unnamed protein product [Effrenium voratum]
MATAVKLNVYYQHPVSYDEKGRLQQLPSTMPRWLSHWTKDVVGVYHVGVEVHGKEYCYGIFNKKKGRSIGGPDSGVFCHQPRDPGWGNQWKCEEVLGSTRCTPQKVLAIAFKLGKTRFGSRAYSRTGNNCVDFASEFLRELGAEEVPSWCQRGLLFYRGAAGAVGAVQALFGTEEDGSEPDATEEIGKPSPGDRAKVLNVPMMIPVYAPRVSTSYVPHMPAYACASNQPYHFARHEAYTPVWRGATPALPTLLQTQGFPQAYAVQSMSL